MRKATDAVVLAHGVRYGWNRDAVVLVHGVPDGYITGLGRDVPNPPLAHLYKGDFTDPGKPMCRYGWNRDDGTSYSIWRGNVGRKGICRICMRRARAGLPPIESAAWFGWEPT